MENIRAPEGQYTVWAHEPHADLYIWIGNYHSLVEAMMKALAYNREPAHTMKALVSDERGRIVEVHDPRDIKL